MDSIWIQYGFNMDSIWIQYGSIWEKQMSNNQRPILSCASDRSNRTASWLPR